MLFINLFEVVLYIRYSICRNCKVGQATAFTNKGTTIASIHIYLLDRLPYHQVQLEHGYDLLNSKKKFKIAANIIDYPNSFFHVPLCSSIVIVINICDVQYLSEPDHPRKYTKEDQDVEVCYVEKFVTLLSNDVSDHIMEHSKDQYCIKSEHNIDADL